MSTQKPKATRQAFGESLATLGAQYPNIVVLDADLAKSTKSELFAKQFPERFFEMGIAEQNMLGVAAGLGLSGKTAFCCSFACFLAGRFETIKISVAYSGANVKMIGTHAGIGIGQDGYSQMGLEDIALMRSLPNMQVFQPADEIETHCMMQYFCAHPGPAYLRLTRQNLDPVHNTDYVFKPGQLDVLHQGKDVALFATGGTVMHAVKARTLLQTKGVDAAVINVPSIKPLDAQPLQAWAQKVPLMVTIEDHTTMGGMGSAVAEAIAPTPGAKLVIHGVADAFGESAEPEELYAKHQLDAQGISTIVLQNLT